jgi:predicted metal-dependent peptidase
MSRALVSQARRALVLDFPFFGVLSLKLDLIEDERCRTFETDGKSIRFNPEFAASLSRHELMGVIAHEVLHCSNGHQWRRGNRDAKMWNQACDYAVNPILLSAKLQLPKGGLVDPAYNGMSAEDIYDRLMQKAMQEQEQQQQQQQQAPENGGHDASDFGSVVDCAENEMPEMKADWTEAVLNAARQAEKAGQLPAGLKRLVEDIRNPPQNWRSLLRRFVQQACRDDYSWSMPSGRFLYAGLYLPTLKTEAMSEIVVAVDTSGSIDTSLVSQFQGEINAIANETRPERIHVLSCDARVHVAETFERGEMVEIKPKGGGGTNFEPVFKWVEEQEIFPACLIYLTDMEGRFPAKEPDYPVLWVNFGWRGHTAPFGETISIRN